GNCAVAARPRCSGSGHRDWGRGAGRGPVTQLAEVVLAPALRRAVPQERTGVVPPPARDGNGAGDADYAHGGGRARPRPIAELPVVVPPPALHRAVPKERTGVIRTSGDGVSAGDSDHSHRGGGPARPRHAVEGRPGPITELPVDVPPPAPHRVV